MVLPGDADEPALQRGDDPVLIAGFDAGQTGTRCRISRSEPGQLRTLGSGEGPGVCHLDAEQGEHRFRSAVRNSVSAALDSAGFNRDDLDAAAIGASGIEQGTELQKRASTLLAEELGLTKAQVVATGDERTALRGAFPDRAGIVLISGTGMICVGRDRSGREHRCGGWGWLLDGAGSAFDIGHQGLQLSLRMADGRLADHPLRQRLWQELGCDSNAAIKACVVQPAFGPAEFAALAPLVAAAAAEGLQPAQQILDHSAASLAEALKAVATALNLNQPHVVGHGGALAHLPRFRSAVDQALKQALPQASWCEPDGDACDGALHLALDRLRPH